MSSVSSCAILQCFNPTGFFLLMLPLQRPASNWGVQHVLSFYTLRPNNKRHLVAKMKASDWLGALATGISATYWWLLGI